MTFQYHSPFPLRKDETPFRKLDCGGVRLEKFGSREFLVVEPEAIRALSRSGDDRHQPSAAPRPSRPARERSSTIRRRAANDKFVAFDLLKNANIAAGGVLPMCQDTGTAIVMGKKGQHVFTEGGDEERHRRGHPRRLHQAEPALFAARAADACSRR